MSAPPSTHGFRMRHGRHHGELITRVPVSYLKWMVNQGHTDAEMAQAELDRRGTVTPDLDVSGHAIDSASLRLRRTWHEQKNKGEGLHAWLCRVAQEAIDSADDGASKIHHQGIKFVFERDGAWPVLKTVMPSKRDKPA